MKTSKVTTHVARLNPSLSDCLAFADTFSATANDSSSDAQWLPVDKIENLLIEELGYEDQPEFEDALKGSFLGFLDKLPHTTKKEEDGRYTDCFGANS